MAEKLTTQCQEKFAAVYWKGGIVEQQTGNPVPVCKWWTDGRERKFAPLSFRTCCNWATVQPETLMEGYFRVCPLSIEFWVWDWICQRKRLRNLGRGLEKPLGFRDQIFFSQTSWEGYSFILLNGFPVKWNLWKYTTMRRKKGQC